MFLPIKTNDVVQHQGRKYVVDNVQLTPGGPVLEISPVRQNPAVVHASEVSFVDGGETIRRAKSVGIKAIEAQKQFEGYNENADKSEDMDESVVVVPEGMTVDEAKAILKMYA